MVGFAIVHDAVAVVVHADLVHRTVGLRVVGLLGQAERIVEEALCPHQRAANDGERPANRVHPLVEGREDQRIAAIDHLVVDRHHIDGLRDIPLARVGDTDVADVFGKAQLWHDRRGTGGAGDRGG